MRLRSFSFLASVRSPARCECVPSCYLRLCAAAVLSSLSVCHRSALFSVPGHISHPESPSSQLKPPLDWALRASGWRDHKSVPACGQNRVPVTRSGQRPARTPFLSSSPARPLGSRRLQRGLIAGQHELQKRSFKIKRTIDEIVWNEVRHKLGTNITKSLEPFMSEGNERQAHFELRWSSLSSPISFVFLFISLLLSTLPRIRQAVPLEGRWTLKRFLLFLT